MIVDKEKMQIARYASKRALLYLKRNTLSDFFEYGMIKSRFETDLSSKIF